MSLSSQLRTDIESIVTRATALARAEALQDAMKAISSFGGNGASNGHAASSSSSNGRARPAARAAARAARAPVKARRVTGKSGQKRDPEALAALVKTIGEHVNANPGQGVEQIGVALKASTPTLALPIRKLLAAKLITRKGQKRATKYFPAKTKAAAPAAKA